MVYILTGVAGSGKTTVGDALSRKLGIRFYDADTFHTPEAIGKMQAGEALQDEDRWPWLERINSFLQQEKHRGSLVLACSALREVYRARLIEGLQEEGVCWIHLQGTPALLQSRLEGRKAHFMPASLLDSQFAIYEMPLYGLLLSAAEPVDQLVAKIIASAPLPKAALGIVGLGVMGTNLARNFSSKGIQTALYNRHLSGKEEGVAVRTRDTYPELSQSYAFDILEDFVLALASPRKILLMVQAGAPVEEVLSRLLPLLEPGDTILDGGNAHYSDTLSRQQKIKEKGIHFVGVGISGGAEGALYGPAVMSGGSRSGFAEVADLLQSIAARNSKGEICCAYLGEGGAGHFVKMVHNGIEYAEMQLLAEIYTFLRFSVGMDPEQIARIFEEWSGKGSGSYLLEITIDILRFTESDGILLLDNIARRAGAKGSGAWAVAAACSLGVAVPNIAAAVFARFLSEGPDRGINPVKEGEQVYGRSMLPEDLQRVYAFVRITNFFQGFELIQAASLAYGWKINFEDLLRVWSAGCILRTALLEEFDKSLAQNPGEVPGASILKKLMQKEWDAIRQKGMQIFSGCCPSPVISSSLQYATARSQQENGANLIQAQRDYFGAHGFERTDAPSGEIFHSEWGRGAF